MSRQGRKRKKEGSRRTTLIIIAVLALFAISGLAALASGAFRGTPTTQSTSQSTTQTSTTSSAASGTKPIILYINQGNGVVNETNFDAMLSFAAGQGFNTVFFQVYREGVLLFDDQQLSYFVSQAHSEGFSIFFSLYFTNSSQAIPTQVYVLGENGISLDMSTLSLTAQTALFEQLQQGYTQGKSAITTTDPTLSLTPDLLVIETYTDDIQQYAQYIHPGVIASVGVFDTTSKANYQQEFQYALQNSSGVMVFDYAGLMKSGY